MIVFHNVFIVSGLCWIFLFLSLGFVIFAAGKPYEALDLMMKTDDEFLRQVVSDLALDAPFVRGVKNQIKNCWHICTDGTGVDRMFDGEVDFVAGMNRVCVTLPDCGGLLILAFSLMDTHIHFVMYGDYKECVRYVHNYISKTSRYVSLKYGEKSKFVGLPLHCQSIGDDYYLKVVICYVIKNAPVGGIPFNGWDYPWSSGPLYFRQSGYWSSPVWSSDICRGDTQNRSISHKQGCIIENLSQLGVRKRRRLFNTKKLDCKSLMVIGNMIFPGEYVPYELVERIFRTHRSFLFFMSIAKEEDVDSLERKISKMTIPIQELRQHRNEMCMELFGTSSIRSLNVPLRVKLAMGLRHKYNCSLKQIARVCCVAFEDLRKILR